MYSKSRDETECSDRVSPMGFEVTADEFHQNNKSSSRHGQVKKSHTSRPIDVDKDMRKYSTIQHHGHNAQPIDVDDITMDDFKTTDYNPSKYSSAEEAKKARRLRRGEC